MPLLLALALAACTGDGGLSYRNDPPTVSITAPLDHSAVPFGVPLRVEASVTDDHDANDALGLALSSSRDGVLQPEISVGAEQVFFDIASLSTGEHTLTVVATDADGASGQASLVVAVLANQAPQVRFLAPSAGALLLAGDPVQVVAEITDDESVESVTLSWGGAAQGVSGPGVPQADGTASLVLSPFAPGSYVLDLSATDAHGATGTGSLTLDIADDDADDDGVRGAIHGGEDCDDGDALIYPGAPERCNGVDDDCDGDTDEGSADMSTYYIDADADGVGGVVTVQACARPPGASTSTGDCADGDPLVFPGAAERCNGADDDCDGVVPASERIDGDADGYVQCADCNDIDGQVFPGAAERCNGVDDDCDGAIPATETSDGDGDGSVSCADCDDAAPLVHPGAVERCNGVDDDCDGQLPADEATDADGDTALACEDCDDADPAVSPFLTESCNAVDDDCDGLVDADACWGCVWEEQVGTDGLTHTYQLCDGPVTWHDALADCQGMGYGLAEVGDAAEQSWLFSAVNAAGGGTWWLGGADELVEGSWGWVSGATWGYAPWEPGQPDNGFGGEDCLEIGRFLSGSWNDTNCGNLQAFVCEVSP